ncbi:MAG: class I SAM-dependent methyltransferase [Actinomycetota bacterium]
MARKRAQFFGDSDLFSCGRCGTECLLPQPADERLAEIYSSAYYQPWSIDEDRSVESMKRATFEWILGACPLRPGARVLDLGCATGFFLRLGIDRGLRMWGCDLNAYAIDRCRTDVPSARVHCGVLADHPFPGVQFDAIFMVDFIEHVRDPEEELRIVMSRLADGGFAVLSTPRADSRQKRFMGADWVQYKEEHLTYFSLAGLTALLERCGFEVVDARSTRKTLMLGYAHRLLQAYPHPLLTPASRIAYRLLPFLRSIHLPIYLGEMTVVARKRGVGTLASGAAGS